MPTHSPTPQPTAAAAMAVVAHSMESVATKRPLGPYSTGMGTSCTYLIFDGQYVAKSNGSSREANDAIERICDLLNVAAGGWQPIETAPKDGTFILVVDCRCPKIMRIKDWLGAPHNAWRGGGDYTHWRALPPPPLALAGKEQP